MLLRGPRAGARTSSETARQIAALFQARAGAFHDRFTRPQQGGRHRNARMRFFLLVEGCEREYPVQNRRGARSELVTYIPLAAHDYYYYFLALYWQLWRPSVSKWALIERKN